MASQVLKSPSKLFPGPIHLPPSPPPADVCHQRTYKSIINGGKTKARKQIVRESASPSPPVLEKQEYCVLDAAYHTLTEISEPPVLTPDSTPTKSSNSDYNSDSDNSILEEHSYARPSPPAKEIPQVKKTTTAKGKTKVALGMMGLKKPAAKKRVRSTKKTAHTTPSSAPNTPVQKQRKPRPNPAENNTKVTDFFPVRRSNRKTAKQIKREQESNMVESILNNCEDGLEVVEFPGKGRGVLSTKRFRQGDFVVEYVGDLINLGTAKDRENEYSLSPETGCYMYYFKHNNKSYCVDATGESGKLGRLLNHSRNGNCCTKVVDIDGSPSLILIAGRDIGVGEELQYDYGDRSKESIEAHPWLAL